MPKRDEFEVAYQATSPAEAELIRGLLEENGLVAVIPDRNIPLPGVDLTPLSSPGGAACDVLVPARDLEEARRVIRESRAAAADDEAGESAGGGGEEGGGGNGP